jgi:hypothetical protein
MTKLKKGAIIKNNIYILIEENPDRPGRLIMELFLISGTLAISKTNTCNIFYESYNQR